jgi:hypothetical protein
VGVKLGLSSERENLKFLENKLLSGIFGPKIEEVTGVLTESNSQ